MASAARRLRLRHLLAIVSAVHRRAMLQWLQGELPSPDGKRVYLYRQGEPGPSGAAHDARRGVDRGFMHPGRWRVYRFGEGPPEDYDSPEAILDAGWLVD